MLNFAVLLKSHLFILTLCCCCFGFKRAPSLPCFASLSPLLCLLFSSHASSSPLALLSGRDCDPGSAHSGCGLVMQPSLERCFPASLPAVTRRDLFFSCPLAVSPCRASISAVKDGAPDAASLSARALCRMSPVGVRRGFSERTESHREGG